MTLSPFEVERREFGRVPFGYRPRDVDHFLDEVHRSLSGLWQERGDVREENERLKERLTRFEQIEDQLKNTLLLAQDSAEKSHEQARRESDLVMREAGQKARDIVHVAHEEKQRLEMVLRDLHSAEQEARQRLRSLAGAIVSHLDDTEQLVAEGTSTMRAVVTSQPEAFELRGAMSDQQLSDLVSGPGYQSSETLATARRPEPTEQVATQPTHEDAVLHVSPAAIDEALQATAGVPRDAASSETADSFFDAPPSFDAAEVAPRRERAAEETTSSSPTVS